MKSLIVSLVLSSLLCLPAFGSDVTKEQVTDNCLTIANAWMAEHLNLTKHTPGYSAPVAARTFTYLTVGMYEAALPIMENNQSLVGQLNGFTYDASGIDHKYLRVEHLINYVNMQLATHFYQNMPPANEKEIGALYDQLVDGYTRKLSKREDDITMDYGQIIVKAIIAWSDEDGAGEAWNKNFPDAFQIKECEACWEKTHPGYMNALQPYWGSNRLSIQNSGTVCDDIPFLPFSTDPESAFYAEADKMNTDYKLFSKEHIDIARYWNDAPGVSGTPAGHIFQMGLDLVNTYHADLEKTLEFYVTLGVGINDAVIECWRLKYHYNLIRPITYIQRYIAKDFSTSIATPPFPEFPSGHSFQAGCGTEILKYYFSDTIPFTDTTNVGRVDINGKARTYPSFTAMSEEMSLSRFYGGIHFMNTLNVSLDYGRKMGNNAIQQLKFRKP